MLGFTESVKNEKGFNLHFIKTKKYKTLTIVVKIKGKLDRETITKRALLPYILQQGTENYATKQELQKKLADLYGASLSVDGGKKGESHILSLRLELANEKFVPDASSITEEGIALLNELLFHPRTVEGSFDHAVVRREKDTLLKKIQSVQDDKMAYANTRLIEEMCENEAYRLHVHGYEEDLPEIDSTNLYNYYKKMLMEDQIDIYIQGDYDEAYISDFLSPMLHKELADKDSNVPTGQSSQQTKKQIIKPKEIIEKQQLQQAKLHIGYRTNVTFQDDDYFALHVFNGIFGGFPSSKLFINVREKNSLAYYAASRMESQKGLLLVFSGIAPEDYEKARDIIRLQVVAMKNGDFSEEDMKQIKELITNQLLETMDHPQGLIELLYQQVLSDWILPPNKLIDNINKVTKEDVIQVAKKLEEDTLYLLTTKGDSSDE
ncbi:EF-P 5-aminopentanol modification-associated protein YfmF [Virgibacillus sp. SK37]|uniref:EF-P 5-aminopentanol modification-associated protein YfmF n=1 Tax=Virgibacillus sp. SK37 TaxID=403957 RepID=UPI0004D0B913|nr:pitrilysin family protein [Virgibacillus sp. SK37]AIF43699.1 zinc protease [Virgibacillus sp. SK37]